MFIHNSMATTLQLLKFQFLRLAITFSVSLAPIKVMVPDDLYIYKLQKNMKMLSR